MILTSRDFYFAGPEVEGPHRYRPGGYHPVHLGDLYNHKRYKIIHKLGFGTYSTVWLARDLVAPETRYVALKFVIAQLTDKSIEVEILQHLARGSAEHPGFQHVLGLLDHFRVQGVNGIHDVLVLEVMGPRLGDMIDEDPDLLQTQAKSLAHQIVLGTAYLHESGVAHGDLHTGNVAFQIGDLNGMPEQTAMMCLGTPQRIPVVTKDHEHQSDSLPKYIVIPGSFVNHLLASAEPLRTKIIDLGEAFFTSERPTSLNVPVAVRAPELVFNKRSSNAVDEDWDSRTDIWSLGCLIYELVAASSLFHPAGDEQRLIFDMTRVLGNLPERWKDYWDWNKKLNPDGTPLLSDTCGASLEQKLKDLKEYQELTKDDTTGLADLLRKMLVLDPKNRIAVPHLLDDPWFDSN